MSSYYEFVPTIIPNQSNASNVWTPLPPGTLPLSLQEVFVIQRENPSTTPSAPQPITQPTYVSPALSYTDTSIPIQIPNATKVETIIQPTGTASEYISKPILSGYEYVPTIINNQQTITSQWQPLPVTTLPTQIQEVFVIDRPNAPPADVIVKPVSQAQPNYVSPALPYNDTSIPILTPNTLKIEKVIAASAPEPEYVSRAMPETNITFPMSYDYGIHPSLFSLNAINAPPSQPDIKGLPPLVTYTGNQPLYASAFDTTLAASNWWRFPAQGTVSFGSNAIIDVSSIQLDNAILSATEDELLVNGIPLTNSSTLVSTVSHWASYPATGNIDCQNYEILSTTSIQLDNVFLSATPYELLINGIPVVTSSALASLSSITDWALFSAISTIDCDSNLIMNCKGIELNDRNVITSTNNILLVNNTNPVESWSSYKATSNIDVNSKNINNANQLNFITALPGPLTTGATINGLNSLNFSFVTAGLLQAGINNVNNISFWNQSLPIPGASVNLYTKNLTYGAGNQIYLATDTYLAVPRLFLGGLLGTAGGMLQIIGDDAVFVTVNNQPCPAAWSRFVATQAVNTNLQRITNSAGVEFAVAAGGPFNLLTINAGGNLTSAGRLLVTSPATADVNMNNFGLTAVRDIKFNAAGKLLATNGGGKLTYDGQVITTGPEGSASNWAQYEANHNVVIPPAYNLSINPNNSVTFFPDCKFNANIYHGVAGSLVSPDFISFPTTFQVGTTLNPAREITMTAGAEGFGINSDTEINIDATALVNIYSEGVVSIESLTDFNLTASLTTFEIGEFNVAAAATTFEVASFDVASAGNVTIAGTIATLLFGATTITTAGLGLTSGAVVAGVASWNMVSAGNVTTVGTQIGFTAGTKFETLSSGDTNLVAQGNMNIQSLNTINLNAPIVNISSLNVSTVKASTISVHDVNAYNLSSVNLYVESMFCSFPNGQINVYDNLAGSGSITAQTELFAPKVRASTIYGSSGLTSNGQLFLETPLVTATNNFKVTNTLYGDDARFLGQTTLSSIQSFVGVPVTFNNNTTNIPNNATISTLTVQTVNGYPYPFLNQSGFKNTSVIQAVTTTYTLYDSLTETFTANTTGYCTVTGILTTISTNAANWSVNIQIEVNGVLSGNIDSYSNTGNGHQTQVTTIWRFPTVAGTTYTIALFANGSSGISANAERGTLSFISGLI